MKQLDYPFLTIGLALFFLSCSSNHVGDYEMYGLNRPVQSVQVTTYEAESKFGEITKGDLYWDGHYLATFNSDGNIDTFTEYDDDGDVEECSKYKYNKSKAITERIDYDDEGILIRSDKLKYNDDNNLIEEILYDKDGCILYCCNYELDGKLLKKQTETFSYGEEKTIYTTENILYNGKWPSEATIKKNGVFDHKRKFINNDEHSIEYVGLEENGKIKSKFLEEFYTYNPRRVSKHQEDVEFDKGESVYSEIEWNKKMLPIYLKNAELHRNTFVVFTCDDNIYYVEYEYDKKGNWIKQIVYKGEIKDPYTISERVIVY